MNYRRWFSLAAVVSCIIPSIAFPAKSNLALILDASGSMWGRVGDSTKIVEAKNVLAELLTDVPPSIDISLIAYGHRRKGDCKDIEILATFGTPAATISEQVDRLTPKGKTPITESLQLAANQLTEREEPSTLVLVSDGIETCKGDPCALAETLRSSGTKLVIHTVGFGVGDDAQRQLQCIAENGGGNYYHADSGKSLRDALFAVRNATAKQEPPPPPPVAPLLPEVNTGETKRIVIAGPGTILLEPASWVKMPPYRWNALDAETGEKKGHAKSDRLRVKAGEYRLVWRQTEHYSIDVPLTEVVTVASKQTVKLPIDTGLRITAPKDIAAPYKWALRPSGVQVPDNPRDLYLGSDYGDLAIYKGTLDPQVVPAGSYRLLWHQNEHQSRPVNLGLIEILPGKLNEMALNTGLVFLGSDWIPGGSFYSYELVDAQGELHGYWRRSGFGPQLVPPGTYHIRYRQTEHGHSPTQWGPVNVPETGFATFAIDSGVRFVVQDQTPPPDSVFFVNLESGEEVRWRGKWKKNWEPIPVPPGRYRLDWHEDEHQTERMTLHDEFEIPPGTLVEIEL